MDPMLCAFTAAVVRGAGRGKDLGTPTINLSPEALSSIGEQGIYAVWAIIDGDRVPAVMHAGDRPVFDDEPSVEVHLLGSVPETVPAELTVEVVEYLRPVADFATVEELQAEIRRDILLARATLGLDVAEAETRDS